MFVSQWAKVMRVYIVCLKRKKEKYESILENLFNGLASKDNHLSLVLYFVQHSSN